MYSPSTLAPALFTWLGVSERETQQVCSEKVRQITELKGLEETSRDQVQLPHKAGPPQQAVHVGVQAGLEYLQRRRICIIMMKTLILLYVIQVCT